MIFRVFSLTWETIYNYSPKRLFQSVTGGMEARKDHVSRLTETADKLINVLLSMDHKSEGENTLPDSIRSQVADILDSWNNVVKKSIELKSKVHHVQIHKMSQILLSLSPPRFSEIY